MKYKRTNTLKLRLNYHKKKELKKIQMLTLSVLCENLNLDINFLRKVFYDHNFIHYSKLRIYCIFSGRSKGLCKQVYVSRIKLRDLSFSRIFSGLRKISW